MKKSFLCSGLRSQRPFVMSQKSLKPLFRFETNHTVGKLLAPPSNTTLRKVQQASISAEGCEHRAKYAVFWRSMLFLQGMIYSDRGLTAVWEASCRWETRDDENILVCQKSVFMTFFQFDCIN